MLTPDQLRMLKDLTFRTFAFGSGIMFDPEVWEKVGVAQDQQDKLRALESELQKEKERRLRALTREKIQKMLGVLTPQQRSRLREEQSPDKQPGTDCSNYPYPMLPSPYLPDSGAAEALGLSAKQRDGVRQIVTAHQMTLIALQAQQQRLQLGDEKTFNAVGEKQRQEMANLRKQIEAALTPAQWALFKEMAFENIAMNWLSMVARLDNGPASRAHKLSGIGAAVDLAEQLFNGSGITAQQVIALRKIEAECCDKPEQIYREMTDKALAAFTPAQREKLRAEVDRRGW